MSAAGAQLHVDRAARVDGGRPQRRRGAPGAANGTTVLLAGDAFEPAPLSLTETTVNAYCVPYSSSPAGTTRSALRDSPTGAVAPADAAVTAYLAILLPCPLAAGQSTLTVPSGRASAVTLAGGSGTSAVGITGLLRRAGPAPLPLTACTLNR